MNTRFAVWLSIFTITGAAHAATPLVHLKPIKVEYGMTDRGHEVWGLAKGPGVIDLGSWGGRQQMPWPEDRKIIQKIDPDYRLPAGQAYSSFLPDVVAIEGDFKTGVCLLAMSNCMYHWYEYAIPAGAKKFTGKVYLTDDVGGRLAHIVAGQALANQDVILRVTADDKQLYEKQHNRMKVAMGSGVLIEKLAVDLPAGAKVIRFSIESTTFPENLHNEILINDGLFE